MTDLLKTATDAAQAAGQILCRYFRDGVSMRTKSASVDLVSDADVSAERAIAEIIRQRHPTHSILGEEELSADTRSEHLWIVDPLDGTTNFAHGIPHFAVSIAYYHSGVPALGVVWNPVREDMYVAEDGKGATHNGKTLRVSSAAEFSQSLIGVGFYYDRGAMMKDTLSAIERLFAKQIHGIRRCGTASLDLAMVAAGQFSAYFEYQLSAWDFAAGRLLVQEAGGTVTTCEGHALPLQTTSVLASNGVLHNPMLKTVQRQQA